MKGIRLIWLALMWLAIGAHAQDFKKADNMAAMRGAPLTQAADENREAILHAPLSQRLTPLPPSVRPTANLSHAQKRFLELPQDKKEKNAVSFEFGMDLVSRYVWRGIDYGNAPAFQPNASVALAGFEFGVWGSFAFGAPAGAPPYTENEWYLEYATTTPAGPLTAGLSDYYYPSNGLKFFNYRGNNEGAHTLELSFNYGGTGEYPLSVLAAVNVYNDTSNSIYLEAGYSFVVEEVSVKAFVGGTEGESAWYEVADKGFRLINVGVTLSRNIPISTSFSLPVSVTVGFNPYAEQSILVFKISL
jgi:hypothetical protein